MNVRKVIGMVLLSFSIMASVSASYTDALKQKYADGSFYIEYQVTRQDAKGEIAKNQKPRMWSASQNLDKFIYAQKGDNKYYQRNDFGTRKEKTVSYGRKLTAEELSSYRESVIANVQMFPLSFGYFYNSSIVDIQNEDINVIKDGKIYALDRYNACGYWTTAEKINDKPRLSQIMCVNMIIPTIFNSILVPAEETGAVTLISSEPKHTMGQDTICETYTYQKTNEYGSPIGETWYYQLFYKDGALICFSDAISKQYYDRNKDKHFDFLNKVNTLHNLEDDSIFNVIDDYAIEEFEVE